jgi:hypothetical protein
MSVYLNRSAVGAYHGPTPLAAALPTPIASPSGRLAARIPASMPLSRRPPPPARPAGLTATLAGLLLSTAACRASGGGARSAATRARPPGQPPRPALATARRCAPSPTPPDPRLPTGQGLDAHRSGLPVPVLQGWHDETFETLRREYVETGKVRVAYLHFPLDQHEQALPTAEAAMCAGAGGSSGPTRRRSSRAPSAGDGRGPERRLRLARVGRRRRPARFRPAPRSRVMRAWSRRTVTEWCARGVQSTPSFFVGSTRAERRAALDAFRAPSTPSSRAPRGDFHAVRSR